MRRLTLTLSAALTCASGLIAFAGVKPQSAAAIPTIDSAALVAPAIASPVEDADDLIQSSVAPAIPAIAVTRRQIWMEVTAYCSCTKCCGPHANGMTASGLPVTYNLGRFAAADSSVLPLGTGISVPGYHDGKPVPVIDRGGAIKGSKLDVFFPTHERALQWGRRWVLVTIETPANAN